MIRVVNVRGMKAAAREGVCYCGRASGYAMWSGSLWCNPFKIGDCPPQNDRKPINRDDALRLFWEYVEEKRRTGTLDKWLEKLWEACKHGELALGCWCTTATAGDGSEVVCHAQILAELLHERYEKEGAK